LAKRRAVNALIGFLGSSPPPGAKIKGIKMNTIEALRAVKERSASIEDQQIEMFIVGGYVRDLFRGVKNDDLDVVVTGIQLKYLYDILSMFGNVKIVNISGADIELILFRAHGDTVEAQIKQLYKGTIPADLATRDFTINSLYLPIDYKSLDEVIDFCYGVKHIKDGLITHTNEVTSTILQSPIRMMRAFSLAARTGFEIDILLRDNIEIYRQFLKSTPVDGIRSELNKILLSEKPSTQLIDMCNIGVLEIILPELDKCYGLKQDPAHHMYDIFHHCVYACDAIEPDLILRLSALFHDIGKAETYAVVDGRITSHRHEIYGARLTNKILKRLIYPNEVIEQVTFLVKHHMFHYTRNHTDNGVRRMMKRLQFTDDDFKNISEFPLFKLRKADRAGNGYKTIPVTDRQKDFEARILKCYEESKVLTIKDLDIDGYVLMSTFDLKPSPTLGFIMKHLLNQVFVNPSINNRRSLVEEAKKYLEKQVVN
jgi:tRNA nucleotidyltransferase (CCA-adding enzyme)